MARCGWEQVSMAHTWRTFCKGRGCPESCRKWRKAMALPQEINERAWFEWGSSGGLLQTELGLRASMFRAFVLPWILAKKVTLPHPKLPQNLHQWKRGGMMSVPPQLSLQCSSSQVSTTSSVKATLPSQLPNPTPVPHCCSLL